MKKRLFNHGVAIMVIAALTFLAIASTASQPTSASQSNQTQTQQRPAQTTPVAPTSQTQQQEPTPPRYWTGDGGRGLTLAILEPTGRGLSAEEQWFLSLIQGSITGDFNRFSAMTITDRQNLEKILDEQTHSMSGIFSDEDYISIGRLTNARLVLTGSITKTANTYMMELAVTDVESGERKASYPPRSVTPASLENLSAIREASADLLEQLGVSLTDAALQLLKSPLDIIFTQGQAVINQDETQTADQLTEIQAQLAEVQAQIALARGITAQRQGTEVAAMSYFLQASGFDPSLHEAVDRSNIIAATINSGNIGDDARNDVAWRRQWVERLTETEQHYHNLFNATSRPYTLFFSTEIIPGRIDYQNETQTLSIHTNLRGSMSWLVSVDQALLAAQAVYDAFKATGRTETWGLGDWPRTGVTNFNPFINTQWRGRGPDRQSDFSIVAELLNSNNIVIGRATFQVSGAWGINRPQVDRNNPRANHFYTTYSDDVRQEVFFYGVNVNEITDRLTIRIASVNNIDAQRASQTGLLQIRAMSGEEWNRNLPFTRGKGAVPGPSRGGQFLPINFNNIWDEPVPITPVTSGNTQFFAILEGNSAHVYSVIVPSTDTLTAIAESSTSSLRMWLLNEAWGELARGQMTRGISRSEPNQRLVISRNVPGTYYVVVFADSSGGTYSLYVSTD